MKRKREQPPDVPPGGGEPEGDGEPMPKLFRPWETPPPPPPAIPLQQSTSSSEKKKTSNRRKKKTSNSSSEKKKSDIRIKLEKSYQAFGRNIR